MKNSSNLKLSFNKVLAIQQDMMKAAKTGMAQVLSTNENHNLGRTSYKKV